MPDYFTHVIAADKIFERLDSDVKNKIKSRTLYVLGSQGGDVFFTYNMKWSKNNLGRDLHKMNAVEIFKQLCLGNPSYAAGYATHYALDSTMHPLVYAYCEGKKSPLVHQTFEKDIGLYVSKFYRMRRTILPREFVLSSTGPIYDSIKNIEPTITVTGVERCLKRHFRYTQYLYRNKKQTYKCDYDFSLFAGIIEEAIDLGVKAVTCVLNGEIDTEVFGREFLQKY